jgi:hypothetical protein
MRGAPRDRDALGREPELVVHETDHVGLRGGITQHPRLGGVESERLLDHNVAARRDRFEA